MERQRYSRGQLKHLLLLLTLIIVIASFSSCLPEMTPALPSMPAPTLPPTPTLLPMPTLTPTFSESLLVEPQDGAGRLTQALNSARKRIQVTVYLLTYRDVITALETAAARGVTVQVILEDHPYGGGSNKKVSEALKAHGVAVKAGNPAFRYTHQKTVTIDDRITFIMTANLTYSAFHKNREFILISEDPVKISEIDKVFAADWERRPPNLEHPKLVWSPINSRMAILELIDNAKRGIEMYQEEMYDSEMVGTLVTAAEKEGVDIKVIGPYRKGGSGRWAQLSRHGVHVHRLKTPFVHAKVIIVDGQRALIGSVNLSNTSLDYNRELAVETSNPAIIQRLQSTFASDWRRPTHTR